MEIQQLIAKLEKHEAECNLRYARIEERLDDQKEFISKNSDSLSKLDIKIWGLAVLIIVAPLVHKFWGV